MTYTFAFNTIITCLLVLVPNFIKSTNLSYTLVLFLSGLFGFSVAFLQVTLYGVSGPSAQHTAAFMVGIGASGIIVNFLRILLILTVNNNVIEAYIIFFSSALFLGFCTYLSHKYVKIVNHKNMHNSEVIRDFENKDVSTWSKIIAVYRKNWVSAFAVCLTFAIQYTFFPGVMFLFELSFFSPAQFSWFCIFVVTFHSFADTIGRYLGGKFGSLIQKKLFLMVCCSRFIFVLTYLLTFYNQK